MKQWIAVLLVLALFTFGTAALAETPEISDELREMMEKGTYRPADVGFSAEEQYNFPYMGMNLSLPQDLLERIADKEVYMTWDEGEVNADMELLWADVSWSAMTSEQRDTELSMTEDDMGQWLSSLRLHGKISMVHTDVLDRLDELTGCTQHEKLGESPDGRYQYYLSIGDQADAEVVEELRAIACTLTTVEPYPDTCGVGELGDLEGEAGESDVPNMGEFTTEDIYGNTFDQNVFAGNKLTLVNVMATWCSPCVQEMPELEKLRQAMADKGLGVVAWVMDTRDMEGNEYSDSIEKAKILAQRSGAQFPMLMPESTMLGGKLLEVTALPTTFFVDSYGNIISDDILGARNLEQWQSIVEQVLEQMPEIAE